MIAWSKADDDNESVNKSIYSWFLRILQTDAASEKMQMSQNTLYFKRRQKKVPSEESVVKSSPQEFWVESIKKERRKIARFTSAIRPLHPLDRGQFSNANAFPGNK